MTFTECLDSGEERGDRFPDAGRCCCKQPSLGGDRPVYSTGKAVLSGPVFRIRETQFCNAAVALNLPFREDIGRPIRDNVIDGYINQNEEDVCADGIWQNYFTEQPAPFTKEEQRAYLDTIDNVALGSDAFFPFSDNIDRAKKSGVKYVAEPGGSIRDQAVIDCADSYNMVMAFTGMRLFHH